MLAISKFEYRHMTKKERKDLEDAKKALRENAENMKKRFNGLYNCIKESK